ncbi:MAG: hypothetical protein MUE83_06185 [Tabrizicola sp.]|nr:hypothetical protein [Tabrizicola sp.]
MPPSPARKRVILHFGPPKTGTSALQAWCAANSEALALYGVRYASFDDAADPKHQWLLQALQTGRFDRLRDEVSRFAEGTLILSCEGVLVHRRKIAAEHWSVFRDILSGTDRQLFLVRRQSEDWVRSLWCQSVLNPGPHGGSAVPSLSRFARAPELQAMLALPDLARQLAEECGATSITLSPFEGDWLGEFLASAEVPPGALPGALPRVHETPPEAFVQLYRALVVGVTETGPLRRALFALYCRTTPTTSLTLSHTAREFDRLPPAEQSRHMAKLASHLEPQARGASDSARLAETLLGAAAAWTSEG